jgi:hypothetical protein
MIIGKPNDRVIVIEKPDRGCTITGRYGLQPRVAAAASASIVQCLPDVSIR